MKNYQQRLQEAYKAGYCRAMNEQVGIRPGVVAAKRGIGGGGKSQYASAGKADNGTTPGGLDFWYRHYPSGTVIVNTSHGHVYTFKNMTEFNEWFYSN